MLRDLTAFFWVLKLGALVNAWLIARTLGLPDGADARLVVPALILFGVSAFRCLFPVWYGGNRVFHDSPLSSIFATRLLATFSEVAYVYQFSHVLRVLNVGGVGWIDALSWLMVLEVTISQGFVWGAILSGRSALYFWEELGWFVLFAANTGASVGLLAGGGEHGAGTLLLQLNVAFGAVYLPWQANHLRILVADARAQAAEPLPPVTRERLADGLCRSIHERNATSDASAWGGVVGATWMLAYWATLIPVWVYVVVDRLAIR